LPSEESRIFLVRGLDRFLLICPSGKSPLVISGIAKCRHLNWSLTRRDGISSYTASIPTADFKEMPHVE
jgi:hypothetical protein